jgi:glutamine amidotransferase
MSQVTLVNYGLGNIKAFANIYDYLNIDVSIASDPSQLKRAKKLILPGVGSFDWAISHLNNSGLRDTLDELVTVKDVPILGVCVGMQMMASESSEGSLPGLGWIKGTVCKFPTEKLKNMPLPHMGWNDIDQISDDALFENIKSPLFYFLHSYHMVPEDDSHKIAEANYGMYFTAAVRRDNIFGTQFHPEKSHSCGIELLKNFESLL